MAQSPARRVSIALATFNGARFLPEQLASFLAQTRLPDELVVGDDGSSDETLTLLEDFAAHAPFAVRIARNAGNLGHARNFFETMRRCSGDVIFPSDQDDVWHADKIARMLEHLDANPGCWLAAHDADLVDGDLAPLGLTLGGQIEAVPGGLAARDLVAGCCMAIDARLACLIDPPPRTGHHDAWLAQAAADLGLRSYLGAALIDHRRHGGNVSASFMSQGRRANRWTRFRHHFALAMARPVREALGDAIAGREDLIAAIGRCAARLEAGVSGARIEAVIGTQMRGLARDRRRLAIHTAPRLARPARLIGALIAGSYAVPRGLYSLARDIVGLFGKGSGR